MSVWTLGLNHTTAPLDLRGRFAFALDQLAPTLQSLRSSFAGGRHPQVEAAIISTCNRTEIYCAAEHAALDHTVGWLAESGGVAPALLRSHAYTLQDDEAARHVFRVASGLDSMVLGEAQILGQMKDAVRAAETAGALGSTLNQLFQRSFAVAKRCAPPPRSARIPSAWPRRPSGWPASCSKTCTRRACCSSARAR